MSALDSLASQLYQNWLQQINGPSHCALVVSSYIRLSDYSFWKGGGGGVHTVGYYSIARTTPHQFEAFF